MKYVSTMRISVLPVGNQNKPISSLKSGKIVQNSNDIYEDTRGMNAYQQEFLHCFADVQQAGRSLTNKTRFFETSIAQVPIPTPQSFSILPNCCSQRGSVISGQSDPGIRSSADFDHLSSDEEVLAYLLMAWVGDNVFLIGQAYVRVFCVNCPENRDTVLNDLKEIDPPIILPLLRFLNRF